jgi:hypothetical protein
VGFSLELDTKNNILRVTLEGRVIDGTLLDAQTAAAKCVASIGPCRGIVDLSKVTEFDVSSELMREQESTPSPFPTGYMRVMVAPTDVIYGMYRMMQIVCEQTRPDLRVVRTLDEAYRLLQVEAPEFVPLETT